MLLSRAAGVAASAPASSGTDTELASRALLETAVVWALRSDPTLKRSVSQGLALIGVLLEKEQQQQRGEGDEEEEREPTAGKAVSASAAAHKGKATLDKKSVQRAEATVPPAAASGRRHDEAVQQKEAVRQGLVLVESVVSEVFRRAEAAAEACTALLMLQPPAASDGSGESSVGSGESTVWLLQLTARETSSPAGSAIPSAPGPTTPSLLMDLSTSAALLPPGLMISPTCRELQAGLIDLVVSPVQPASG